MSKKMGELQQLVRCRPTSKSEGARFWGFIKGCLKAEKSPRAQRPRTTIRAMSEETLQGHYARFKLETEES